MRAYVIMTTVPPASVLQRHFPGAENKLDEAPWLPEPTLGT